MDSKKLGKWVIAGIIGLAGLFFALPILSTIVWNLVSVIVGLMVIGGLYFLLPALAEIVQQGSYWLWDNAIRRNPVGKLWRELMEFGKEIESLDDNRGEFIAARTQVEAEYGKQRQYLDPADRLEWEQNISELKQAEKDLEADRLALQEEFNLMKRDVQKNEALWKLALAQGKAGKALQRAGKIGGGTDGARVAMSEIQDRLASSKARLQIARSKRSIDVQARKNAVKNTIDVQATEVQPAPALSNNPSPTLTIVPAAQAVSVATKNSFDNKLAGL